MRQIQKSYQFGLIILIVSSLSACRFGSSVVSTEESTPPPHGLTLNNVSNGQNIVTSSTLTVNGTCNVGDTITFSGTLLANTQTTTCLNGTYSIDLIISSSPTSNATLILEQSSTPLTGSITVAVNVLNHCGGSLIQACALSGTGNSGDPYLIGDISCLQKMSDGLSCHYKLNGNVDATSTATWNSGDGWIPVSGFSGVLDGNNHTISALKCISDSAGLFGALSDQSQVKNLILDAFDIITGAWNGGALASNVQAGTIIIQNVEVKNSTVRGGSFNVSALIGEMANVAATISLNSITIRDTNVQVGGFFAGGIVGVLMNGPQLNINGLNLINFTSDGGGGLIGYIGSAGASSIQNVNINGLALSAGTNGYIAGIFDDGATIDYYSSTITTLSLSPAMMPSFGYQGGSAVLNIH
ncbi:hypothetical protein K2X05_08870 [bacterium]|nr:hypothetical protein [bacterium]